LKGFEPTSFLSGVCCDDHCATMPGNESNLLHRVARSQSHDRELQRQSSKNLQRHE
jgi:hypothetical protein